MDRAPTPIVDARLVGQVDIDARAEADEAKAVAGVQMRAFLGEADDAAGDHAGDLDDAELSGGVLDHDAVALVGFARLVEIGAQECAGVIGDAPDPPLDRRAVHVAVEHRHEDRHPLQRLGAEAEFGRRRRRTGEGYDAVGRSDDQLGSERRHPRRIAEEIGAPQRRDQRDPAERRPDPEKDQRRRGEGGDEDVALRMDGRQLAAHGVDDRHGKSHGEAGVLAPIAAKVTSD